MEGGLLLILLCDVGSLEGFISLRDVSVAGGQRSMNRVRTKLYYLLMGGARPISGCYLVSADGSGG